MLDDLLYLALGADPVGAVTSALLYANLAAGVVILAVTAVRPVGRRLLGPETAYKLWALPPLAAIVAVVQRLATSETASGLVSGIPRLDVLFDLWAVGAIAVASVFAFAQVRFMASVGKGEAGPAVVGLISPRIVMPADDGRYTAEERGLIRAHEREHVARKDPRGAALAALFQCLCWFNPLVHWAAHLLRLDQELACDAAVIRSRPTLRALYARTLLKTQLAATPLPFGCYFGAHPLEVRVEMLKRRAGKRKGSIPLPADGATIVFATGDVIRP